MYMKIIYFGYNKKDYLDSCIDGVFPYQGEYLDIVSFKDKSYLITQGVSKFRKGIIYALEIMEDVYLDGSFVVYVNSYKSKECMALDYFFNCDEVKNKLLKGAIPLDLLKELGLSFTRPNIIPINDDKFVMAIIIKKTIFENTRDLLIENKNKSFAEIVRKKIYKQKK